MLDGRGTPRHATPRPTAGAYGGGAGSSGRTTRAGPGEGPPAGSCVPRALRELRVERGAAAPHGKAPRDNENKNKAGSARPTEAGRPPAPHPFYAQLRAAPLTAPPNMSPRGSRARPAPPAGAPLTFGTDVWPLPLAVHAAAPPADWRVAAGSRPHCAQQAAPRRAALPVLGLGGGRGPGSNRRGPGAMRAEP